jgi:hypothetical protein
MVRGEAYSADNEYHEKTMTDWHMDVIDLDTLKAAIGDVARPEPSFS